MVFVCLYLKQYMLMILKTSREIDLYTAVIDCDVLTHPIHCVAYKMSKMLYTIMLSVYRQLSHL